jgi:hypothetical protein
MELQPSDVIALVAIGGTVLVGVFSPFVSALAAGRKEKRARTEERRDEAYTRLMLALRIERIWIQEIAWRGVSDTNELIQIPDPDESEWVEARVRLVGSDAVKEKVGQLRTSMDSFSDKNSKYLEMVARLREEGRDPDADSDCVGLSRDIYAESGEILEEIEKLEDLLRSEII